MLLTSAEKKQRKSESNRKHHIRRQKKKIREAQKEAKDKERKAYQNAKMKRSNDKKKAEKTAALATAMSKTPNSNNQRVDGYDSSDESPPKPMDTPVGLFLYRLLFRLTPPCLVAHAFLFIFLTVSEIWSHARKRFYSEPRLGSGTLFAEAGCNGPFIARTV